MNKNKIESLISISEPPKNDSIGLYMRCIKYAANNLIKNKFVITHLYSHEEIIVESYYSKEFLENVCLLFDLIIYDNVDITENLSPLSHVNLLMKYNLVNRSFTELDPNNSNNIIDLYWIWENNTNTDQIYQEYEHVLLNVKVSVIEEFNKYI